MEEPASDNPYERLAERAEEAVLTYPEAVMLGRIPEGPSDQFTFLDDDRTRHLAPPTLEEAERIAAMHSSDLLTILEENALGQFGGHSQAVSEIVGTCRLAAMEKILGEDRVLAIFEAVKHQHGFNYEAAERYRNAETREECDAAFAEVGGGWIAVPFEALRPMEELLTQLDRTDVQSKRER